LTPANRQLWIRRPFSYPLIWRAANRPDARILDEYAWFRMVSRVFDTINTCGLKCLIGVSQLGHTFVGGIFNCGEPLRIARLSGTVRSYLPRIVSKFILLRFISGRVSLGFTVLAHEFLLDGLWMQVSEKRMTWLCA
jgi:hypothetical protein